MNKEDNKYYTPEIEEFRVGFKFELSDYNKTEWKEHIIDPRSFCIEWRNPYDMDKLFHEYLPKGRIRVKYLDSQDIIDCGFVFKEHDKYRNSDIFIKQKELGINQFEVCKITLFKDYQDKILLEYYTHTGYEEQAIYKYLKIKNKSKLKEVLQMVGTL